MSTGDPRATGADGLRSMRDAYGASAPTWAKGPARIYRLLAEHLVRRAPWPLAGLRVVDVGTGTGVLARALADAGAAPIGIDLAFGMVRHDAEHRPPALVADATHLPVADDAVDGVGAAFSLTHVPTPEVALAEIRRITRPGGHVLAISYHADNDHPVKAAVDRAAGTFGFEVPAWHGTIKGATEPTFASVATVTALFTSAGFEAVEAIAEHVDLGIDDARTMVDWRLGMASLAPFVATLTDDERADLIRRALHDLGAAPIPYRPHVIVVTATEPGSP